MYGENKKPCNECAAENIDFCLGCPHSTNPNEIYEKYKEESDIAEKIMPVNKVYKVKKPKGLVYLYQY